MLKVEFKTTGDLESAVIAKLTADIKGKVERALGPAASSLTVRVTGDLKNLKLNLSGPDEAVEKAKKALGLG